MAPTASGSGGQTVPPALRAWFKSAYPTFAFDEQWLVGCCQYLQSSFSDMDTKTLIKKTENQLLLSDLADSLSPSHDPSNHFPPHLTSSTDFPDHSPTFPLTFSPADDDPEAAEAPAVAKGGKKAKGVLVQILSISEIGHSAWSLSQTLSTRIDRRKALSRPSQAKAEPGIVRLADLDLEEGDADKSGDGKFARGMLRLVLSDGTTTVNALEIKRISALELGETPLGSKILLHPPITVRRGHLLLHPDNTTFKGGKIDELDSGIEVKEEAGGEKKEVRIEGLGREEAIKRDLIERLGADPFTKVEPPAPPTKAKSKPKANTSTAPAKPKPKAKAKPEPEEAIDDLEALIDDYDDHPPAAPKASTSSRRQQEEMDEFDQALMMDDDFGVEPDEYFDDDELMMDLDLDEEAFRQVDEVAAASTSKGKGKGKVKPEPVSQEPKAGGSKSKEKGGAAKKKKEKTKEVEMEVIELSD